jgi:hypothetical protein
MATPRKLWETNVGLRPATHIMSTFVCLAIATVIAEGVFVKILGNFPKAWCFAFDQ